MGIEICDATFKAVDSNGDGLVQFEEYAAYCRDHPELLRSLTVDVQDIVKDGNHCKSENIIKKDGGN